MKVLVTGGAGYIGSHAVRKLVSAGHQVTIYDSLVTGHRELCADFPLIVADVGNRDILCRALDGMDAVMHFAASAYVGESTENPQKYFHNNVKSGIHLLDAVLESSVRLFVFSSSCAVYGVPARLPIVESFPTAPVNPYGDTKLMLERILSAYSHAYGLRYMALRYFNAAGADESAGIGEYHEPETHLIPLALKSILGKTPPLNIFGHDLPTPDGTCIRDFVHVNDLACAHVKSLEYLESGGTSISLNLGLGRGMSIREILDSIHRVTGERVPHKFVTARVGDPPALYADSTLAKTKLNWEPQFGLEDILRSAWNWEREGFQAVFPRNNLASIQS